MFRSSIPDCRKKLVVLPDARVPRRLTRNETRSAPMPAVEVCPEVDVEVTVVVGVSVHE
jgi:hypothetical protein